MQVASSLRALARARAVLLATSLCPASSSALADLRIGVGPLDNCTAYLVCAMQKHTGSVSVAMGEETVDVAVRLARKDAVQGDIWIPVQLATPDNHTQFQRN